MQRSGQTLLEALLAITIIAIGVVSVISLLISTRSTAAAVFNESIAIQLGQEAIEGARFVRDSNWLKQENGNPDVHFNDGLHNGLNYGAVYQWNPTAATTDTAIRLAFVPGGNITSAAATVYYDSNGYYQQTSSSDVPHSWTPTIYRRWLTLYPVCRDATTTDLTEVVVSGDGEDCGSFGSTYQQIGVQVIVQLQWSDRGTVFNRSYEQWLYNWKYAD